MVTLMRLDSIPVPAKDVVSRIVQSQPGGRYEAVLVLPARGKVQVLNELGARIWSLTDGKRSVSEIAAAICLEYAVDSETAERDTLEFLEDLLERGVVQIIESRAGDS